MTPRTIPETTLSVSPICLGTMTFGTPVAEAEAIALTRWALDSGINFIDTANMYEGYARSLGSPGGVAEEILGKALQGRRDQAVLATKVGMKVGNAPEDEGTNAAAIRVQLDRSLQRLRTDYVDIYYLHTFDSQADLPEMLGALQQAMTQGKIRYYGVSNYSAEELAALLRVADAEGFPRPVIHQPPLSLLKRDAIDDLLPLCESEGIAAAPYQVLQGGLLTGKYKRGEPVPVGSRKAEKDGWVWDLTDELFDEIEAFAEKARSGGLSLTQYAIRWVLDRPAVVSALVGAKSTEQLQEAILAAA